MSQAQLYQQLQTASDPEDRRDAALDLLDATLSRQYLDEALRVLHSERVRATIGVEQRDVIRRKAIHYFSAPPEKDRAGMLRESLLRLLVYIGDNDDLDLYLRGVETYYLQPVDDVAQNLRAVALAGIASVDPALAQLYATRLLGEQHTSVFNCEPAMTSVDVLARAGNMLPIYQFLLLRGVDFLASQRGEVVGKALEALGGDFPVSLYRGLAEHYIELDAPDSDAGIINYIVEHRVEALYDLVETIITETKHPDVHRFGVIALAAGRNPDLTERLYTLAKRAGRDQIADFVEAVELTNHADRDSLLESLHKRR